MPSDNRIPNAELCGLRLNGFAKPLATPRGSELAYHKAAFKVRFQAEPSEGYVLLFRLFSLHWRSNEVQTRWRKLLMSAPAKDSQAVTSEGEPIDKLPSGVTFYDVVTHLDERGSAHPQDWSKQLRSAIRQVLDQRVSQANELTEPFRRF